MTLDDIRRLNIREVGNWPLLPRAALLFLLLIVIVAIGAYLVWKDQYEALDRSQQEEATLKEQYATKKAKAINYDIYVQQLKEIEQSFGALLKQLPNKAEMDALLTDIKLDPPKEGVLAMEAVAKTYRYLDEEEVAKQRKTAKDKAAKQGAKK